jgi:hypothetical protein
LKKTKQIIWKKIIDIVNYFRYINLDKEIHRFGEISYPSSYPRVFYSFPELYLCGHINTNYTRHLPRQSLRMPPTPASPGLLTVSLCRFSNPTPLSCTEETCPSEPN